MNTEDFDKVLAEFAEEVNNTAKRQLGTRTIGKNKSYGVSSFAGGADTLQRSLTYDIKGQSITFSSPKPYATFIHWGVNGTRKSQGAPYSYKYENPSRKHVDAMVTWMKAKRIQPRDKDGRFIPSTPSRVRSLAWALGRAVKRKGIVGLRYYVKAIESVVPMYAEKLGQSLANDMLKAMRFKAGNITFKLK